MELKGSIISFVFICVFLSCKNDHNSSELKVFHYNQPNAITSLDPAFAKSQNNIWAVHHLYDGLVRLDTGLHVLPAIARDWQLSNDGKLYTFNIRNDVLFHKNECFENKNSRKVTASDFVYSFNRLISENVNSPGSWLFKDRVVAEEPFIAIDDSTFQIRLKEAFRPFLGILTMQYCSVLPQEAIEYHGNNFRMNPVGTGPFAFKKWIEDQALFLKKNEDYFLGPSTLDGVRTSFIADRKIAFLELLNGKIEFNSGLESSFINELLTKEGNLQEKMSEKIQFIKSPYLNTEYLGINMNLAEASDLQNKKLRQALNYAINRPLMLQALRNNVGHPADAGFIPRGLPSYNPQKVRGYNYDIDKAVELLKEAGFPSGKGLAPISITTNQDYVDLTTFIAKEWEKIGIQTDIKLMESAVLRQGMRNENIPLFRASWIADYPDGESFLCMFYSKNPAPPNYTRFSNEHFDRLYEQSIIENDELKRMELYWEMDNILIEEAPVIFLFYDETALFASNKISNFETNAINLLEAYPLKHQ
jgi:peptide/nickel transport system substrate-binding protein